MDEFASRQFPVREDMRMHRSRITEDNILEAARRFHGLERMEQIKFAILESAGAITIVPAVQAGRLPGSLAIARRRRA